MSLRLGCLVIALVCACGGAQSDANEPQTAREKQLQEAKAKGELDEPSMKWAGWKYQGDRKDCFYVVGRKCYKTKKIACSAAKCGKGMCGVVGAGPATVQCKKPKGT